MPLFFFSQSLRRQGQAGTGALGNSCFSCDLFGYSRSKFDHDSGHLTAYVDSGMPSHASIERSAEIGCHSNRYVPTPRT